MSIADRARPMTKGVESILRDGGNNAERVLMVVEGLLNPHEVTPEQWFRMLDETNGIAIRIGGVGRYAYYMRRIDDETVAVTDSHSGSKESEHGRDDPFVTSTLEYGGYDPYPVVIDEVSCL